MKSNNSELLQSIDNQSPNKEALYVDGTEVGYAMLERYSEPFNYYYLESLDISPEFQGQGLGNKLLEQVNQRLEAEQTPAIVLNFVAQMNLQKTPAIRKLYENNAWEVLTPDSLWFGYIPKTLNREEYISKLKDLILARDNN